MEVMTDWWTVDSLYRLPDDGMRYEIADGCLLVSPPSTVRHAKVLYLLCNALQRQAPPGLAVSNLVGIQIGDDFTYFIPDLFVIPMSGFHSREKYLLPADVQLVVEILAEHNRG